MKATMTMEQLFARLNEKLTLAHKAKTACDEIVSEIVKSSVTEFCDKRNCKPLQDMLNRMVNIRRAGNYYNAIVENLASYMGLPITIVHNKKTNLHTCRFAYDNPEQANDIIVAMDKLCKEIKSGEKEDFWTIVKKEKEAKRAAAKKSDYEIVQSKMKDLANALTKKYGASETKLEELEKLINSIID